MTTDHAATMIALGMRRRHDTPVVGSAGRARNPRSWTINQPVRLVGDIFGWVVFVGIGVTGLVTVWVGAAHV
jgi:hypothetical protein